MLVLCYMKISRHFYNRRSLILGAFFFSKSLFQGFYKNARQTKPMQSDQMRRSWEGSRPRGQSPPMKILGANISFCAPPPNNFDNLKNSCNARIGLKCTVRHYRTIKFNIKILLNIHHFQVCGAYRARKVLHCNLKFWHFPYFPPPPIRKMDRRPWWEWHKHGVFTCTSVSKVGSVSCVLIALPHFFSSPPVVKGSPSLPSSPTRPGIKHHRVVDKFIHVFSSKYMYSSESFFIRISMIVSWNIYYASS